MQDVAEGQGVRRQRKSRNRRERERDTGKSAEKVCRGWDSIVRRSSAAAIQGISGKRVCRGWDGDFL